jgi:ketosteroid isomerase-like protein
VSEVDTNRQVARTALEQVCSRGDMTLAPRCYAEDFADYVGSLEYHGLDGVERSTALYRALFDDLAFDVVDQVAEGDRVASRFVLTGSNRGRRVRLWGITISRLRDGADRRGLLGVRQPRAAQATRAVAHVARRTADAAGVARRPRKLRPGPR